MEPILGTADRDERVRAVALNGSRANPKAPRDLFQDYNIVYLGTERRTIANDPSLDRRLRRANSAVAATPYRRRAKKRGSSRTGFRSCLLSD
ncbi:aminoglycoside 6-adenylyltransferase [Paenibacillus sp. TRM 82003]|nr:aminoglycoside 6-adenylyltransferase [Paenibacillus sp. TRM 82003]